MGAMTNQQHPDDRGLVEVAIVLVGLQAAIGFTGVVEALVFASMLGAPALGGAFLTAIAASAALVTAIGLGRRARWARRWALIAESAVLALALLDAVLAPLLLGTELVLVSLLTRVVVPVVVIGLLRRPAVISAFARPKLEVPA